MKLWGRIRGRTPLDKARVTEDRLYRDRIILLGLPISNDVASRTIRQIHDLAESDESAPVHLCINSPGGALHASLELLDAIQRVNVHTLCIGKAQGTAALIVAGGKPGERGALPTATIQLMACRRGPENSAIELQKCDEVVASRLSEVTGCRIEEMIAEMKKGRLLGPQEAIKLGIIDNVVKEYRAPST